MNAALLQLAGVIARPRGRRCVAGGWTLRVGATDSQGRHPCPQCAAEDVAVTQPLPRVIRVETHIEVTP